MPSTRADSAAERLPIREPASTGRPRRSRWRRTVRVTGIVVLAVLGTLIMALASLNLAEERIRRYAEAQFNEQLPEYHTSVGRLDLQPFTLSLELQDLTIAQKDHPDPPIAHIPKYRASLQWGELVRGHLVSDHTMERPVVHLTPPQAQTEAAQPQQEKPKSWQAAVTEVYPVTINEFKITEGELTYLDAPGATPLDLKDIDVRLGNIRNVRAEPNTYPSDVHVAARLERGGHIAVDGKGDLFAEPLPAIDADVRLDQIEIGQFRPIASALFSLYLGQGTASMAGHLHATSKARALSIQDLTLDSAKVDYMVTAQPTEQTEAGPTTTVTLERGRIKNGELGVVDKTARPEYRVFLSNVDATLQHLSTVPTGEVGSVDLHGLFMGSGDTRVVGTFRPETPAPDFDLTVRIETARLPAMNDLLRAFGKFDVADGRLSVFSELKVRKGVVDGYVKPLISDLKVYDRKQDRGKPLLKQAYEGVIGGVSGLLQNEKTGAVATKAEVTGRLDQPNVHTWQTLGRLLRNAFIRAILPRFG